jgi:hypothetical protein
MLIAPPREETVDSLLRLLSAVSPLLEAEPSHVCLPNDRPIVFVGDTHGDLACTRRVIERYLPSSRLVFVGDYVDRAPEPGGSIGNIAFLLRCKVAHPERVILLRGNHEFRRVYRDGGFTDALLELESPEGALASAFEQAFSQLPYVATTDNGVICLHGGLPDVWRKDELYQLPKGATDYLNHAMISQTVWNDNVLTAEEMTHPLGFIDSPRVMKSGHSLLYGEAYLRSKLEIAGGRLLIRGHDFRTKGYSLNDRVLTIMTNQACAGVGNIRGAFVARLDPRRRIATARDLAIDVLPADEL